MTNKETIERNIGLTFDFVNYLIENPSVANNFKNNFELEFIEKDFPNVEKKDLIESSTINLKKYVRVRNTFELAK